MEHLQHSAHCAAFLSLWFSVGHSATSRERILHRSSPEDVQQQTSHWLVAFVVLILEAKAGWLVWSMAELGRAAAAGGMPAAQEREHCRHFCPCCLSVAPATMVHELPAWPLSLLAVRWEPCPSLEVQIPMAAASTVRAPTGFLFTFVVKHRKVHICVLILFCASCCCAEMCIMTVMTL